MSPTVRPRSLVVKIKEPVPQAQHDHNSSKLECGVGRHPFAGFVLIKPGLFGDGGDFLELENEKQDERQHTCRN
jgi:hypothetical protein